MGQEITKEFIDIYKKIISKSTFKMKFCNPVNSTVLFCISWSPDSYHSIILLAIRAWPKVDNCSSYQVDSDNTTNHCNWQTGSEL
jgi:hypothetical protein